MRPTFAFDVATYQYIGSIVTTATVGLEVAGLGSMRPQSTRNIISTTSTRYNAGIGSHNARVKVPIGLYNIIDGASTVTSNGVAVYVVQREPKHPAGRAMSGPFVYREWPCRYDRSILRPVQCFYGKQRFPTDGAPPVRSYTASLEYQLRF